MSLLLSPQSLPSNSKAGSNDPDVLAAVIEGALNAKRPKPVYSVRPDRIRSALDRLPLRTQDQVYLTLLRRADKRD